MPTVQTKKKVRLATRVREAFEEVPLVGILLAWIFQFFETQVHNM